MRKTIDRYQLIDTSLNEISTSIYVSPSELHGLLVGRSIINPEENQSSTLKEICSLFHQDEEFIVSETSTLLYELEDEVLHSLSDNNHVTLPLLLPSDNESLAKRTSALSFWCQGFIYGFGLKCSSIFLSTEVEETLTHLVAISHVKETSIESEIGEREYAEIVEYLRISPFLILDGIKNI